MTYFYAHQLESLAKQCIRVFSEFKYKTGANAAGPGQLLPVPCKYGDCSRMVAQIIKNNSQNTALSAPMFAVWFREVEHAPDRRKGPVLENELLVTERGIDPVTGRYTGDPGNKYEVDLLMPVPVNVHIQVDLLTSNTEQLWQLWEQVTLLFNPAIDIQMNENALDWSSLTYMELESMTLNSKTISADDNDALNVSTWIFKVPFWINPPAKVKKVYDIRTIITDLGRKTDAEVEVWGPGDFAQSIVSAADHRVSVVGNTAILLGTFGNVTDSSGNVYNWSDLVKTLGQYEGDTSIIRFRPGANIEYTAADVLAHFTFDENEVNKLNLSFINSTLPVPTISGVNNIIDPRLNYPGKGIPSSPAAGTRYMILASIAPNTVAWGAFGAETNSIIEWDGSNWIVSLYPSVENSGTIVENLSNNKLYVMINDGWVSAVEGQYSQGYWDFVFF